MFAIFRPVDQEGFLARNRETHQIAILFGHFQEEAMGILANPAQCGLHLRADNPSEVI
jgi:hypothetical protein